MNVNGLSKLYDRLKPAERLPLIVAAAVRGDEVERQRLALSAPKALYQVPDHFALGMAMQEVSTIHIVALLDLAANFWLWWGLWGWGEHPSRKKTAEREVRTFGLVQWYAYQFTINDQAWQRLCAEMKIEAAAMLDFMPGANILQRTREHIPDLVPTFEQACIILRLADIEVVMPPTVEEVLDSLRELVKRCEARWDGGGG